MWTVRDIILRLVFKDLDARDPKTKMLTSGIFMKKKIDFYRIIRKVENSLTESISSIENVHIHTQQ